MLQVYAYNAGKGDCIRIRFDGSEYIHNVFIDSGVTRFSHIFKSLCNRIVSDGERLDLLILTHADEDHIGGMLSSIRLGWKCPFEEVRMNHSHSEAVNSTYLSTRQNDELYAKLMKQEIIVNPMLSGDSFTVGQAQIDTLWPHDLKDIAFNHVHVPLARHSDYYIPLTKLAEMPIDRSDMSRSNKNSIIFIFSYNGHRLLFTGDAWAEDITNCLRDSRQNFDLIKVPHHGAVGNISEAFPESMNSENYLICTDGIMHPDKQTVAKLIKWYGRVNIYSPSYWWGKGFFTQEDDIDSVCLRYREGLMIEWE